MIFSLVLCAVSGSLYLFHYLFGVSSLPYGNKVASFMGGIALVGMILAVACFCLNLGKAKVAKKNKFVFVIWMVLSVAAFLAFAGFIVVIILDRAHIVGVAMCVD